MQIVRQASFAATPWKNGGGITYEAMRVPVTGPGFRWRVSVAQIDRSGPFSDFAGYDRTMVLLRGAGVHLTFNGERQTELRRVGDMVRFDGAVATQCRLLDGPCTDLNLMVSQALRGVHAWTERLRQPRALQSTGHTLVFAIDDAVELRPAAGAPVSLGAWDLALLAPGEPVTGGPGSGTTAAGGTPEGPLVFCASLDDNPV